MATNNKKRPTALRSLDAATEQESKRQEKKAEARAAGTDRVFRFSLKQGNGAEAIILDASLDDGCHFHEHNIKGVEGYYNVFEACPKEFYDCPLCAQHGESGFILYLSILHLNAFKDKNTGDWRDSRSLLPIKYSQLPTFKKVLNAAEKKHGTLRGVVLNLERPTGEVTQSPRIDEPVEFESNNMRFDFIEDLEGEFGHDAFTGDDGKILKAANLDITAFDYELLFPNAYDLDHCIEDLRTRYTSSGAGADSATDSGSGAWTDEDELDKSPPKRTRNRRQPEESEPKAESEPAPRRRRRAEPVEAEPVESDPTPKRRSGRRPPPSDDGGSAGSDSGGWAE